MYSVLAQGGQNLFVTIFPFLILFVLMYFLFIRPQRKQEMRRRMMLAAIQKNDRVVTNGGLHGVVTNVKEDEVTLKVDESRDVKVRVSRSFIASVVRKDEETSS